MASGDEPVSGLAGADAEVFEATLQQLQRDINCLGDDNRATRKRALDKIKAETVGKKPPLPQAVLKALFQALLKGLLRVVADPVEKNREVAIGLLSDFLKLSPPSPSMAAYLVPVFQARLGTKEIIEPSEEIRKQLLEVVVAVCAASSELVAAYMDELSIILQRAAADPFPDIKKIASSAVSVLARGSPPRFRMASPAMARAFLPCLAHQHARVRADAVEALGAALQHGDPAILDDVMPPLAQRASDRAGLVRRGLYLAAGGLLMHMPDRYSYWHRLLPLLLIGEADELPELQSLAREQFALAGLQFEKENEQDLKEQMDFEPHTEGRPRLGCRVLVQRNIGKILVPLLKDIGDWNAECRRQSARLLRVLTSYAQDHLTMHLEKVLPALCLVALDDESDIAAEAVTTVELIGKGVPAAIWAKLFLPLFSSATLPPSARAGYLKCLCGLVRGSGQARMAEVAGGVVAVMGEVDACQSVDVRVREQMVRLCDTVIATLGDQCVPHSHALFVVLLSIMAANADLEGRILPFLDSLACACAATRAALFAQHTKPLLQSLAAARDTWTRQSHSRMLFEVVLTHAGAALAECVETIVSVFTFAAAPERDLDLRLSFFPLLARIISDPQQPLNAHGELQPFVVPLLTNMVMPSLVWRTGRSSAALRSAAMAALLSMLTHHVLTAAHVDTVIDALLPLLISSLDDEFEPTRLLSCHACKNLLECGRDSFRGSFANFDRTHKLYSELLKRLDDSSDGVRLAVLGAWGALVATLGEDYDKQLYQAHIDGMAKGLLMHLDDPQPAVHNAIFSILKSLGRVDPATVRTLIAAARHKHRNTEICDRLMGELA